MPPARTIQDIPLNARIDTRNIQPNLPVSGRIQTNLDTSRPHIVDQNRTESNRIEQNRTTTPVSNLPGPSTQITQSPVKHRKSCRTGVGEKFLAEQPNAASAQAAADIP